MKPTWKLLLAAIVFVLCIAPTILSYAPYSFTWDDSDYLVRSIAVSKAFWSGDRHALTIAMPSIRPPMMTLLGLPWGSLSGWESAGKCFITLNVFTSFFAALCLFLLLRIGLKPLYLILGSVCILAVLGPFPTMSFAHSLATGFLADSLFAWNVFAAALLIPYEESTDASESSVTSAITRGILWGVIFSAGVMTKASFLYFIALIVPIVFIIRMRRSGLKNAMVALGSLFVCAIPSMSYWLKYGLPALRNGWAASFGHDAPLFYYPLSRFLGDTFRQSPGWLLFGAFMVYGIAYLAAKRREISWGMNIVPVLIVLVYFIIGISSSNREIRYLFPGIIPMPFLIGLLLSQKTPGFSRGSAAVAAGVAFVCLSIAGVPMLHRANRQGIYKSEEVVAQAIESNAKHVILGTDSASLNANLMKVAIAVSSRPAIQVDSLAWSAADNVPIENDYRTMRESDLVVFQDKSALQNDPVTNRRAAQYEQYIRQATGDGPIKSVDGLNIYGIRHNPL